jgi:hypothetical protein
MKNTYAVAAVGITTGLLCLFSISIGCKPSGPPSYISFAMYRSKTYYSNFADACGQLMTNVVGQSTNATRLKGDDARLPPLLQDMHATYIDVASSNVWVVVDTYAGYGVIWHRDDLNSNLWKLTIRSEAEPRDVVIQTNK